ncbi:MAG TPA: ABC transporter permease [Acidimicrobiales bacterium]|nr:ABC transporter permease [Acidimicrobiales bacterium]
MAEGRRNRALGWIGVALVGMFVTLALLAPVIRPYRAAALSGSSLGAPNLHHLLGTNQIGQDLFSQMLDGARTSLLVAVLAGGGALVLGTAVGVLAGWRAGLVDMVLMRMVDVVLAMPRLPLLIVVGAFVGSSLRMVALVIALVFWPGTARAVRSQVLSLRRRTHLKAAVGFGASTGHILRRHVIPEIGLILVAQLLAAMGRAILIEAGLAFLGIGDFSRTSWGSIMRAARESPGLYYGPTWLWWMLPPMMAIMLVLLGLTFIGVAVEQRINPRLARHTAGRAGT